MTPEKHPWDPFLPDHTHLLMLGSFPPQRKRWSMEFYYPNLQNDMWRIFGHLFFGERDHFLTADRKAFDRGRLEAFLKERGVALYDTSEEVIRLKDNASDNFLQVVREVDLRALLQRIPGCRTVAATGGKAAETAAQILGCSVPAVGEYAEFSEAGETMRLYRMPSTSRAYARPMEWKAEYYRRMFTQIGIL